MNVTNRKDIFVWGYDSVGGVIVHKSGCMFSICQIDTNTIAAQMQAKI